MSRAPVLLLTVAVLASLVAPAAAGPKRCPLVVDQPGDTALLTGPRVERDLPELDLRSLDVVSDERAVTVVLQVTRLARSSPENPAGARWGAGFRVDDSTTWLYLWAIREPTEELRYVAAYRHVSGAVLELGEVDGSVDLRRNVVRISAPLEVFADVAPLTAGTWLEGLLGITGANWAGRSPAYRTADTTRPGAHRVAGPACLR